MMSEVVMRRKDREMDRNFALYVADKCEWATLALVDGDKPYCVPVTIVRIGGCVYFHTAKAGRKIDLLRKNPSVCLSCVGDTYRTPDKFTTEYESAVIAGTATEVTDDAEKIEALRALCERHTPTNMAMFDSEVNRSLGVTGVWKISIDEITGKRKKYDKDGVEMKYGRMS